MNINDVNKGVETTKPKKRLGRGTGSGLGKTAGRGHKGQRSRAGSSQHSQFQGGAMQMFRRIPKRGFNNKFAVRVVAVNVSQLESNFEAGDDVNPLTLATSGLGKSRYDVLKILGDGELTRKLKISAHRFSKSAREKIEAAGGEIIVLPGPAPVVKNKQKKKIPRRVSE